MDSPEKYKASEGAKVLCRDTVWRGVIRKAGSRAGKFKDHEEGKVSVCTNKILLCMKCFNYQISYLRAAQLVSRLWGTATGRCTTARAS